MHWSSGYIGIPFAERGRSRDGADCWGLACIVYREQRGVELDSYADAYASVTEREQIAALLDGFNASPWRSVEQPREFDLALFRHGAIAAHVGIVIRPGAMLHSFNGRASAIEAYGGAHWSPRLIGFFRHAALSG